MLTLAQHRSTLHLVLPCILSLFLFTFFSSSIRVVVFILQCRVSTVVTVVPLLIFGLTSFDQTLSAQLNHTWDSECKHLSAVSNFGALYVNHLPPPNDYCLVLKQIISKHNFYPKEEGSLYTTQVL